MRLMRRLDDPLDRSGRQPLMVRGPAPRRSGICGAGWCQARLRLDKPFADGDMPVQIARDLHQEKAWTCIPRHALTGGAMRCRRVPGEIRVDAPPLHADLTAPHPPTLGAVGG